MALLLLLWSIVTSSTLAQDARETTPSNPATGSPEPSKERLCDKVLIVSPEPIDLTDTERDLVCGSDKIAAWATIPLPQKKFFLSAFLQRFGYHTVEFVEEGDDVIVYTGAPAFIKEVEVSPNPEKLDLTRHWITFGARMTPDNLDRFVNWLSSEYQQRGYPCLEAEALAYPETGVVTVTLGRLEKRTFPSVSTEFVPGLRESVLRRYDPFAPADLYDSRLLELSSQRLMRDDVVVSSTFLTRCPRADEVEIKQNVLAGEPRLVTFGVGADTEEYLITEASWKHARFGENATQIETTLRASYRLQRAGVHMAWYYSPLVPRHYLSGLVVFSRKNEESYESVQIEPELMYTITDDFAASWHFLQLGVRGNRINVRRGEGPRDSLLFGPALSYALKTHDYEYFEGDPRSGAMMRIDAEHFNEGIGSDLNFSTVRLEARWLKNLFDLSPPVWIVGLRSQVKLGFPFDGTKAEDIPSSIRFRLGGTDNLRGFGRQGLPDDGALTTYYLGGELRLANVVPWGLQPIVLIDAGRFGSHTTRLRNVVFWNPGVGIHWKSPVGTIRATVAHGLVAGAGRQDYSHLNRWFAYFSYGETF